MRERVHLGLVHHPTLDRTGREVTTAITTLDMHDLARLARTYGLGGVFVQTNMASQTALAKRLIGHWVEGYGAEYNPHRMEALKMLALVETVEEAIGRIIDRWGERPLVAATSARDDGPPRVGYGEARRRLGGGERPALILFGTGWGMSQQLLGMCDMVIEPIGTPAGYNHLSVRSAASITVDRLFGEYGI